MDDFAEDPRGERTSIAAPLIRALLAAAIAFGLYWLVFAQSDGADDVAALATAQPTSPVAAPTVPPDPLTPTTPPVLGSTEVPTFAAPSEQPGAGTSVQVLNGTDDADLMASAVEVLSDLGYDVTESGRARQDYAQTTIFASAGQDAAAEALKAADPRFTTIGENPGNLDPSIDVHVVVGEDWVESGAGTTGSASGPTEDSSTEVPEPVPTEG